VQRTTEDRAYYNFVNAIRSPESKIKYDYGLEDFMKFISVDLPSSLLKIEIERNIIDYILHLRNLKLSSSTVKTRLAAIYLFYAMNDVILNKTKINKYKGEFIKVAKDRAYTHEEIHRLLQIADLRMKICILLMASAGLRIGAIHSIQMKHVQRFSDDNLYKLTIYENTNDEYITFCSPECSNFIDEYKKYRERNGEKITSESYLIRNDFNVYQPLSLRANARPITKHTIREIIVKLLLKSGVKTKEVHQNHGFRKFFTNHLRKAGVQTEVRWSLEGRKLKGSDPSYVRTSEEDLLKEYYKAVPLLTISNEERLKFKLEEKIQIEKTLVQSMQDQMNKFKEELKAMKSKRKQR
jgi:integrase